MQLSQHNAYIYGGNCARDVLFIHLVRVSNGGVSKPGLQSCSSFPCDSRAAFSSTIGNLLPSWRSIVTTCIAAFRTKWLHKLSSRPDPYPSSCYQSGRQAANERTWEIFFSPFPPTTAFAFIFLPSSFPFISQVPSTPVQCSPVQVKS